METLFTPWEKARFKPHDISGIEKPELYIYKKINGIYYPIIKK